MCPSLYALLLGMLVTDLHAKSQHNICKGIEKVSKTVPLMKFTKCKTSNFAKKENEVQEIQTSSKS